MLAYHEEPSPPGLQPTHRIHSIYLSLPHQRQSSSNSGSLDGLGLSGMWFDVLDTQFDANEGENKGRHNG